MSSRNIHVSNTHTSIRTPRTSSKWATTCSSPVRKYSISYAVFCLKKKKTIFSARIFRRASSDSLIYHQRTKKHYATDFHQQQKHVLELTFHRQLSAFICDMSSIHWDTTSNTHTRRGS